MRSSIPLRWIEEAEARRVTEAAIQRGRATKDLPSNAPNNETRVRLGAGLRWLRPWRLRSNRLSIVQLRLIKFDR